MSFITRVNGFVTNSTATFVKRQRKSRLEGNINKRVSNETFKGSFPPGKISQREWKVLKQAEREIEDWNNAILKAKNGT